MGRNFARSVLMVGLLGATAAFAQDPSTPPAPVKHRRAKAMAVGSSPAAPPTASGRQLLDDLVKGSPDQQAAERNDNELAGVKPIDHRKDDFFSDWRGLR